MKKEKKLYVIVMFFAAIGLIFTSCGDGGGGGGGGQTYAIGDTGPGGGIVFYDKGSYSAGWRYLEAAPEDQGTSLKWASTGFESTDIKGTGTEIGTGKENTRLILKTDPEAPAAKACVGYRGPNNKTDWFLPSRMEMYTLAKAKLVISEGWFWSSSQELGKERNAGLQQISEWSSNWMYSAKSNTEYVRAVRYF